MENIVTPIKVATFEQYLKETHYDPDKTNFLVKGFSEGFALGYQGPSQVKLTARNLKLQIGTETHLWNKVMKEVGLKRICGPFDTIPFSEGYIQSPLVNLLP